MSTHRIELVRRDGRRETIAAAADETILAAAAAAGVDLPVGCRTGACATCTGSVLEGEVAHRRPPRALDDRHLEEGYALLCIAEPRSDCRIEVGADVATDLVENPWR